jgi:hypothetical protein
MAEQPLPNSSFKKHGKWRFPQISELSALDLRGELTWDPFDGATLELSITHEQSILVHELFGSSVVVQGQLGDLPLITMDHALIEGLHPSIAGDTRVKLTSYSMVKGQAWVDDVPMIELVSVAAEMTGLRDWTGGTGIDVSHCDDGAKIVKCKAPGPRPFANIDEFCIEIDPYITSHQAPGKFEAEDMCSFGISAATPFTYQRARELVWELNRFLSLALDHTVVTTVVRAKLPDNGDVYQDGRPIPRFLEFYQSINLKQWKAASKSQQNHRIALPSQDLERISAAYVRFSEIYRSHRRALNFYFSGGGSDGSYIHQKFADLVHGLEGLDRGLNGGCYMNADDYEANVVKAMRSAVPKEVPHALRSALRDRLRYGNGFSLRKRLRNLAAKHHYLSGVLGKPTHFGDDVADMRNDIAHAKGSETPTREDHMRYFGMLYRVKLLFQMELLAHLGFDVDFRSNALRRLMAVEIAARPLARPPRSEHDVPESRGVEPAFEIHLETDRSIVLPQALCDAIGVKGETTLRAETT